MSDAAPPAARTPRRILIVGAGIGGLTAALALARVGFQVDIAERAIELSEIGAGIQLSPNAGRVLSDLGLGDALAKVCTEPSALEIRSGLSGNLLTTIGGETLRQRYGFPYWVVHRADLQSILLKAVQADGAIRLHLGVSVTGFTESPEGVHVQVSETQSLNMPFAAAIAADGVRSSLRSRIAGAAAAHPVGRTAWRALVPSDAVRHLLRADAVSAWLGPRAHLVCYPVARGAQVNLVAIIEDQSEAAGWGLPGDPAELSARYAAWSPKVRALLATSENWRKFSLMRVDGRGPWTSGRIALLGDAAHAMTPFLAQGAVMAIEDAAVLAERLASGGDVPSALRSYEALRKGRVTQVAAAAARTGERYHFSGVMAAARDLALRLAGERLILNEVDWIYRWRPGAKSG